MPARKTAEESREALEIAALALFRERPPSEVSVREIARRAGINHGLVQRHYGGKGGLVEAVVGRVFRSTAKVIRARMDEDPEAGVYEGLRILMEERWIAGALAPLVQAGELEAIPEASMAPVLRASRGDLDDQEAVTLALIESAVLGWMVFEPLVARGTGLSEWDEERRLRALSRVIAKLSWG